MGAVVEGEFSRIAVAVAGEDAAKPGAGDGGTAFAIGEGVAGGTVALRFAKEWEAGGFPVSVVERKRPDVDGAGGWPGNFWEHLTQVTQEDEKAQA